MIKPVLTTLALLLLSAGVADAQVKRVGPPGPGISSVVVVPPGYSIVYVAGLTAGGAGTPITPGMDTKAQSLVVFEKLKAALAGEGLTFADVTMMNVYLAGDPAKEGKMDAAGMNEAYRHLRHAGPAQQTRPRHLPGRCAGQPHHAGGDLAAGGEEAVTRAASARRSSRRFRSRSMASSGSA